MTTTFKIIKAVKNLPKWTKRKLELVILTLTLRVSKIMTAMTIVIAEMMLMAMIVRCFDYVDSS